MHRPATELFPFVGDKKNPGNIEELNITSENRAGNK